MANCKVIALCNQKGGVGKTTSTANLGVGLAMSGKKVLLIDADAQANLALSLGYTKPDDLPVSLSDIMKIIIEEKMLPSDYGILRHEEGIDLMPANIELSGTEVSLVNIMSRESILKTYVDKMRPKYDYILIDSMPSLGMMTINSLVAADSVIIPSQPSFLSAKGLDLLMQSIARVRRQINPGLSIDGILLTMVDNRTNEAKEIIASLRSHYGEKIKVFKSEIPFSVRAAESSGRGKSIYAHDKNGKVASAYSALTKEVIQLERKKERFRSDSSR
ncbi:chromosome partitioning protein [Lachnospiraceae bacterium PF1-21]